MERKRPSSSKSSKKQHSQKKKYKGSTLKTRSRIYSPNNSEQCDSSSSSDLSDPDAIADDKRSKKAPSSSSSPSSLDVCNSSSSDVLDSDAIADDKKSKKAPSSSWSPSTSDVSNSSSSDTLDSSTIADDKRSKKAPRTSYFPNSSDLSNSSSSFDIPDNGAIADDKRSKKASSPPCSPSSSDLSNSSSSSDLLDPGEIADDKRSKKEPCSPPNLPNSPDIFESGSSCPFPNLSQISKGDELHKKDGTKESSDGIARNTQKKIVWEKYKDKHAERKEIEKRKELKRSKLVHAEKTGKNVPNASSNEDVADVKFSPMTDTKKGASKRPLGPSEIYDKHENPGASLISQVENTEELKRRKIDDTEEAGEKQPLTMTMTSHDGGSNENIPHMKFSPVTAVGKGIPKRRSDPTNALKENRPRTSL